jgi:hypothetical protein
MGNTILENLPYGNQQAEHGNAAQHFINTDIFQNLNLGYSLLPGAFFHKGI